MMMIRHRATTHSPPIKSSMGGGDKSSIGYGHEYSPPNSNNNNNNNDDDCSMAVSPTTVVFQRNILLLFCFMLITLLAITLRSLSLACDNNNASSSSLSNGNSKLRNLNAGDTNNNCIISMGTYRGPVYNSPTSGTIGQPKCLVESKWLKVAQHTVKFPGSDTTFDDWLWIDYHDRINVVVEDAPNKDNEEDERRFLVFEQSKYALDGQSSLAIIGGIIEPGEQPEHAARREVQEEMKLHCQKFHFLGRYRTDVNRGMGWINGFLATQCTKATKEQLGEDAIVQQQQEEVGAADTERQDLKSLTLSELRLAASKGEFLEVQWTATVAQALLHPELMD